MLKTNSESHQLSVTQLCQDCYLRFMRFLYLLFFLLASFHRTIFFLFISINLLELAININLMMRYGALYEDPVKKLDKWIILSCDSFSSYRYHGDVIQFLSF